MNIFIRSHSLFPPPSLSFSHLYCSAFFFSRYRTYRMTCRRYCDRCCSPLTSCRYSLFAVCAASRIETPRPALYTNNGSHVISLLADYRCLRFRFFSFFFFFFFIDRTGIKNLIGVSQIAMCAEREQRTFIYFSLSLSADRNDLYNVDRIVLQ